LGDYQTLGNPWKDFSFIFWAKHNSDGTPQDYIGKQSSTTQKTFRVFRNSDNKLEISLSKNGVDSVSFISSVYYPDNEWLHIAVTRNSKTGLVKIYKNGVLIDNSGNIFDNTIGDLFSSDQSSLVFGRLNYSIPLNTFNGVMDDVHIYNMEISDSAVDSLYHVGGWASQTVRHVPSEYSTIQSAINAAVGGDTVLVQPGTYVENINFNGKNIVVGSLFLTTQDTSYISSTIIDGNQQSTVVRINGTPSDSVYFSGLTIKNGNAKGESVPDILGGGIYCNGVYLSLSYLYVINNNAAMMGGGVYVKNGEVQVDNCKIKNNTVDNSTWYGAYGGGIQIVDSKTLIENSIISFNSVIVDEAASHGGGIRISSQNAIIRNSVISNNSAGKSGGGIEDNVDNLYLDGVIIAYNYAEMGGGISSRFAPIFKNTLLYKNSAISGAGMYFTWQYTNPVFQNVTICNNYAKSQGGGALFKTGPMNADFTNAIFWGNTPQQIAVVNASPNTNISIKYCDIQGGRDEIITNNSDFIKWLGGNIDIYPEFTDSSSGDFSLYYTSPCIDAGDPDLDDDGTTWENDPDDQDPDGSRMDIGAYYFDQYTSPLADFSATPTSGQVPLEVQFTDQSVPIEGTITNWTWDFGDGGTSTEQSPTHTYEVYGVYTVSLTVVDDNGMGGTETKEDYITANYSGPVWYVSNDGDDSNQGTIDDPFATINYAVNQASSSDSILVYEGLYTEIGNYSKHLFISSIHYPDIDSTTIQNTKVVNVNFNMNTQISDKMEINGFFIDGDGLHISSNGISDTVYINNCHIMNNQTGSGATISDNVIAKFQNCIFENNYHGISSYNSDIIVINSKINDNNCSEDGYSGHLNGSAIYVNHNDVGSATLINTEITNNIGNNTILLNGDGNGPVVMDNLEIINNEGDGIFSSNFSSRLIELNNVQISNNSGMGIGTGFNNISIDSSLISNNLDHGLNGFTNAEISNTIIEGNLGSGIYEITNSTLTNVIIRNNRNLNSSGGGIYYGYWYNAGDLILEGVSIYNNQATYGGGIDYSYGDSHELILSTDSKCSIYENYAIVGTDLHISSSKTLSATLDTFTVATPTDYYAHPIGNITFDITNHTVDPIVGDVYVDPTGSNDNSGTSSGSPYKTISYAMLSAFANSSNPGTIHLADGTYSPSTNGEYFPLGGKDYVSIIGTSQEGTILNGDSLSSIFYIEGIDDITISDLTVRNGGKGIDISGSGTLSNLIVTDNLGKGIDATGNILLENLSVNNNKTGLKVYGAVHLKNSEIFNNSDEEDGWGGGIFVTGSGAVIENCNIYGNSAHTGGGLLLSGDATTIINCNIVNNSASDASYNYSGGVFIGSGNYVIINSIIRDNSQNDVVFQSSNTVSNVSFGFNDISGGQNEFIYFEEDTINWLAGNIDVDPLFADPANGDYHLQDMSPCIGAGIDSLEIDGIWYFAPDTDIEGNPRPNPEGSMPDIGAYENSYGEPQHNHFIYVSTNGNDEGSVGFESAPFATIQAAIDYSWNGDTVLVYPGTYLENINFNGKNIIVGSLTLTIGDTSYISQTIIDGSEIDRVVKIEESNFEICGFTIRNGYIEGKGGGIQIINGNNKIKNCVFINNECFGSSSTGFGGAISFYQSITSVSKCTFINNLAREGGAIGIEKSNLIFTDCGFDDNKSSAGGDAVFHVYSDNSNSISNFNKCTFMNADINAIEIELSDSDSMHFEECVFINNRTSIKRQTSNDFDISVINCTFYSIKAPGDYTIDQSSNATISNSIFWGSNTISDHIQGFSLNSSYSLTSDVGQNNINSDPQFVNANDGNFNLSWGSPAIDAGDPDFDNDGIPWENDPNDQDPDGTRMDMGAYYFDQTDTTPPTITISAPEEQSEYGTDDIVNVEWEAQDNWLLTWAKIYFSPDIFAQFEFIDSVDANSGSYEWQVPDSVISSNCRMSIVVSDYRNNIASDTSSIFSIFDNTRPVVSVLTPQEGFSIPEYELLTTTWNATDNIEMDSVQIIYTTGVGQKVRIMGILPADSSQFSFNIPQGVTDNAMVILHGWDTAGNDTIVYSPRFSVTDNTPPEVDLSTQFSDSSFEIMSTRSISWAASDNVAIQSIDIVYSIDAGDTWISISENEPNDGEYFWLIPNTPSEQCKIKVTATDSVELSDEAISDGLFTIYVTYPKLISHSTIISALDTIQLGFSQTLNTEQFSTGLSLSSAIEENLTCDLQFLNNDQDVYIYPENSFISGDTISLILSADQITNAYGYGLDGNQNDVFEGSPLDNDTVTVYVNYSGDFDGNDQVDFNDLALFANGWYSKDYKYELGPVTGDIPHFITMTDSLFNIEDAMTFGRMWNWFVGIGKHVITMPQLSLGGGFTTEQKGNDLIIHSRASAGKRIVLQYDQEIITINKKQQSLSKPTDLTLEFYADCIDSNRSEYVHYSFNEEISNVPVVFNIKSKQRDPINIIIGVESIDETGELILSDVISTLFQPIPDKFEVFPNYPNPFNSQTVIEYAIPIQSDVLINIYDLLGRKVKTLTNNRHEAKYYTLIWDGKDEQGRLAASGLYFLRIVAGTESKTFIKTKKMVMLR